MPTFISRSALAAGFSCIESQEPWANARRLMSFRNMTIRSSSDAVQLGAPCRLLRRPTYSHRAKAPPRAASASTFLATFGSTSSGGA